MTIKVMGDCLDIINPLSSDSGCFGFFLISQHRTNSTLWELKTEGFVIINYPFCNRLLIIKSFFEISNEPPCDKNMAS